MTNGMIKSRIINLTREWLPFFRNGCKWLGWFTSEIAKIEQAVICPTHPSGQGWPFGKIQNYAGTDARPPRQFLFYEEKGEPSGSERTHLFSYSSNARTAILGSNDSTFTRFRHPDSRKVLPFKCVLMFSLDLSKRTKFSNLICRR